MANTSSRFDATAAQASGCDEDGKKKQKEESGQTLLFPHDPQGAGQKRKRRSDTEDSFSSRRQRTEGNSPLKPPESNSPAVVESVAFSRTDTEHSVPISASQDVSKPLSSLGEQVILEQWDTVGPFEYWTKHQRFSPDRSESHESPHSHINHSSTALSQSDRLRRAMEAALNDSDRGPSSESVFLYQSLLQSDQTVPSPSAFDDPAFQIRLQQESESEIAAVIGDLLVPHAEHLFIMGEQDLEHLHDAVKEAWDNAISPFKLTPKPLYSVGFSYTAFTGAQLRLVEDLAFSEEYSLYRVTKDLYFPFFVADTTSGTESSGPLAGGEELNAHSAMIAMRGIVELFTLAKREHEINNQVIVFSVVFDHASVTIYGHYAEISVTGEAAKYYRHMIQDYKITPGTQNRWISYKFVKAMYKEWAPLHLARIHSAIDALLGMSNPLYFTWLAFAVLTHCHDRRFATSSS
ncbi:hypothetical protein BKA81DRAFT_189964 [Phyllosticta paracitricarpa]